MRTRSALRCTPILGVSQECLSITTARAPGKKIKSGTSAAQAKQGWAAKLCHLMARQPKILASERVSLVFFFFASRVFKLSVDRPQRLKRRNMVSTLLLASFALFGGTVLTYLFDDNASFPARICTGVVIGSTLVAFSGLILASFLPFNQTLPLYVALVCISPAILLVHSEFRAGVVRNITENVRGVRRAIEHRSAATFSYFLFYAITFLFLCLAFSRVSFVRADGLYTGFSNNVGDLPFHLSVITSFSHSQNFPPDDPTFTGSRFTYPFLADLIASIFTRAGSSLVQAQFLENLLLGLAVVGLLHRWTLEMTGDRLAGLIAPVLVFFSGGLGWLLFFKDTMKSPQGVWAALLHPSHDYTIMTGTRWRWGNALTTLLVPQRSMLFGLSVAVVIFTQWWLVVKGNYGAELDSTTAERTRSGIDRRMIAAGVCAGLLPLIHTHTWMVITVMAACLTLLFRNWRAWAIFFAVALLFSAPQLLWMLHGSSVKVTAFWAWHFGWDRGDENAVWFWLRNTGLFIPALVAVVLWRGKPYLVSAPLLRFYTPFLLCFLVPNAITLAPWIWDNIKVLFYWYLASAPLVALLLARFFQSTLRWRIAGSVLLLSLTFAGSLDIWRIVSGRTEFRLFDRQGMAFAAQVLQETEPRSLVLHGPVFDTPLFLTGRRSLLAYPGWAWTRGLDFPARDEAIRRSGLCGGWSHGTGLYAGK